MTGKDLIIYILSNDLENEPVFKNGKFIGLMSLGEVAVKFEVGAATVKTWIALGVMDAVEINGETYIFPNSVTALEKRMRKE